MNCEIMIITIIMLCSIYQSIHEVNITYQHVKFEVLLLGCVECDVKVTNRYENTLIYKPIIFPIQLDENTINTFMEPDNKTTKFIMYMIDINVINNNYVLYLKFTWFHSKLSIVKNKNASF